MAKQNEGKNSQILPPAAYASVVSYSITDRDVYLNFVQPATEQKTGNFHLVARVVIPIKTAKELLVALKDKIKL